jgi:2-polyprenyl-6-methoxyphenol hydroxylase-like FAD-dependent oxidoreductase
MLTPSALIAGASIAGPALAYWLNHYGWRTTIVERAPRLRTGGQNVDLHGPD